MPERPLILFPSPAFADRTKIKPRRIPSPTFPSISRQYGRLNPSFRILAQAYHQRRIALQNSPAGLDPELALVIEVVGSVESFYTAVKRIEGMEWLFEVSSDEIEPDDDFFNIDNIGQREDGDLSGRIYCIMSNQQAINQLLSLWRKYNAGETEIFKRGFSGFRDIFVHIKTIRPWGVEDRIHETHVMEYWIKHLEMEDDQAVPFEIELFYRKNFLKRDNAYRTIKQAVEELGGVVLGQCVIESIAYHAILVKLPKQQIKSLVENYDQVSLVIIDDIMFFRPVSQAIIKGYKDTSSLDLDLSQIDVQSNPEPILGIFDGMPIQNHTLLVGKLIVDDPDGYEENYIEKYRCHGTAMASLVLYGDLNRRYQQQHNRKIYFRPVLKPFIDINDDAVEQVPSDIIFVDLLHRAVRRIFEGDGATPPQAPSIKVINLSIGDPARQLTSIMSPLARLLDWLSNKYKVLFIISAGNHNQDALDINIAFNDFKELTQPNRNEHIFSYLRDEIRNLRVISPAESLNNLTIGALYEDSCQVTENIRQAAAVSNGLPSPISSFGLGYNRTITPDLYYYGGRKFLIGINRLKWPKTNGREPGCKVAAPFGDGTESGQAFSFGTSDAAAQITHEAGKLYDVLNEVFLNETNDSIPNNTTAILLKGMLAHGASWRSCENEISRITQMSNTRLQHWLGNGIPDISRVIECTDRRITLIGWGDLAIDRAHVYTLPLPFDFSTQLIKRRLTVTLSYFSPISPAKQRYRTAQIWFEVEPRNLFPDRQNTNWQSVRRGTLQHEIFSGQNAIVLEDNSITIKVNCKKDAENFREAITYGLFITFEIIEGLEVDVYSTVVNQIRQPIIIATSAI